MNKPKKQTIIIVVLAILLFATLMYILILEYNKSKQEELLKTFQQGAQYGYEQAVIQIVEQAATCEQVPLRIGNQTINIFAVNCLQEQY